ncbi:unnamed protein product [Sphagnum jensenii]|uniref:Uncharacterized protein n=1 Tax=Sphagnum jensenii TaxID=128206 RepID=A0ABP1BLK3_9BRYO
MSSGGTDEAVPVLRQPASQPPESSHARTLLLDYGEGKGRKRERAVRFVAAAAAAVLLNWQPPRETMYPGS